MNDKFMSIGVLLPMMTPEFQSMSKNFMSPPSHNNELLNLDRDRMVSQRNSV